jgi:hypothetical protein
MSADEHGITINLFCFSCPAFAASRIHDPIDWRAQQKLFTHSLFEARLRDGAVSVLVHYVTCPKCGRTFEKKAVEAHAITCPGPLEIKEQAAEKSSGA